MRRIVPILTIVGMFLGFLGTLYFLYEKSKEQPPAFETLKPERMDIVDKAVAPGSIVPRKEVEIKSRVSGVVEKLFVAPGEVVAAGDPIAKIKIIPDVVTLNTAEARLRAAQISLSSTKKEFERIRQLFDKRLLPQSEFARAELEYRLSKHEVSAAASNLELVREGAARNSGKVSNLVTATVAGTVIDVPVKEGTSVIETNTFNAGTTVAFVADMTDILFKGHVDESEVGRLSVGMPAKVTIGAMKKKTFDGVLEYIAPKGVDKEGTIEFEIWAAIEIDGSKLVRSNYSANADIILEKRASVVAIRESVVRFENSRAFVEVEVAPDVFEKRSVELGLSDGLNVQVLEGVDPKDRLKFFGANRPTVSR